jgi:hypothetical protein
LIGLLPMVQSWYVHHRWIQSSYLAHRITVGASYSKLPDEGYGMCFTQIFSEAARRYDCQDELHGFFI